MESLKKIKLYWAHNKLTIANIKRFLQGTWRMTGYSKEDFDNCDKNALSSYFLEQVIWRIDQVSINSPDCLNGICYCGCDTPDLFFADSRCNEGNGTCYPPKMNELEWAQFKKDNKINIKELYKKHESYIAKNFH